MAHGIQKLDKGIVSGVTHTWHGIPSYVCKPDQSVTADEAREVLTYPVEKCQLYLQDGELVEGAYALKRTDHNIILWPNVGERYTILHNNQVFESVVMGILSQYSTIQIESVGTLWNGQKAFVNLLVGEFHVKGDNSKTVNRLMYSNSFGGSSYLACAHSTRIVCDNTRRMATAQGMANETLKKFKHTASAGEKINQHFVDLAGLFLKIEEDKKILDSMVDMKIDQEYVKNFLDRLVPLPVIRIEGESSRATTIATNTRDKIVDIFENCDNLQGTIARSRYALLNAVTDYVDHHSTLRNGDDAGKRFWNGLFDVNKDAMKQKAFDLLSV